MPMILRRLWPLLFLTFCAGAASAHDWYPANCCNDQDCYPMGEGEREPKPRYTLQGWRLHDGRVVSFIDARTSPDGRFHVCRIGGVPTQPIVHPTGEKPCFYAPADAF